MDRMTLQETLLTRPGITGTKRHDTTHSVALFVEEMMSKDTELTISVPEAGRRYFGIGRGLSFEAARRGEIPTIRIGRLLRVPVRAMEAMLDGSGSDIAKNRSAA